MKATHFNKKYKDILSTTHVVSKDVANYTLAISAACFPADESQIQTNIH
jgi:hypothetical protein